MRVYILEWRFKDGVAMTVACKEYTATNNGDLKAAITLDEATYLKLREKYHNPVAFTHGAFRSDTCICSYVKDIVDLEI